MALQRKDAEERQKGNGDWMCSKREIEVNEAVGAMWQLEGVLSQQSQSENGRLRR
jgi:hypothetical protein